MKEDKVNYKKFTDEKLKETIDEIMLQLTKTYGLAKKSDPGNRKKYRREIAKIKTEQTRRKNDIN